MGIRRGDHFQPSPVTGTNPIIRSSPGSIQPLATFPKYLAETAAMSTTTASAPPISSVWADKYRGVRLPPSYPLLTPPGHRRRPRPPARPLHEPHRPHLHRAPVRLRARLHAPDRRQLRHARAARLPVHAAAARHAARGAGAGDGRGRAGDAAVQAPGEGVQGDYDGDAAGGAGGVFQGGGRGRRRILPWSPGCREEVCSWSS